jgi:Mycothiol maleylpyruvate isomerase N-terminal domain
MGDQPTATRTAATFDAFPVAAHIAATLLRDPAVAACWTAPSALEDFRVSGLAGHLASQVGRVVDLVPTAGPTGEPIDVRDHYLRVPWVDLDVRGEVNTAIRDEGERVASVGPDALANQVDAATDSLSDVLAKVEPTDVVTLPWTSWALTVEGLLLTRMLEIVIHSDDLAVSIGVPTPAFPPGVLRPVLAILTELAVERHGQDAVVRALSRAERAPRRINAI